MFDSLRSLSDSQIITGSKVARAQEHSGLLSMMGFIVEIDRRELFLRRGYSSLFAYCIKELGYSESQAMRRITAARCIVKFPVVFELLKANEVNLGTISRVSRILTSENCAIVIESIRGKSLREVEAVVAEYEPVAAFPRDRVRTIVARVPVVHELSLGEIHLRNDGKKSASDEESTSEEKHQDPLATTIEHIGRTQETDLLAHDEPRAVVSQLRVERRARVEFTARPELVEKLECIRALAAHRLPAGASIEQVINFMADYVIHREDPIRRHERRQARRLKRGGNPD